MTRHFSKICRKQFGISPVSQRAILD